MHLNFNVAYFLEEEGQLGGVQTENSHMLKQQAVVFKVCCCK